LKEEHEKKVAALNELRKDLDKLREQIDEVEIIEDTKVNKELSKDFESKYKLKAVFI
jgi:hypothetical protein